jgi:hypothetical protein
MKKRILISLVLVLAALAAGCTARSYYEGFRQHQEIDCQRLQGMERENCLKQSGMSYDEYQRQLKDHPPDKSRDGQ